MPLSRLTLAISKGRILTDTLPLLAAAGAEPIEDPRESRKLILETTRSELVLLVVRASDVPTYVRHGAADLGITGKDVLMEDGADGLYEPLDLGIAKCRLMLAGHPEHLDAPFGGPGHHLRVATKYVETTRRFFAARGDQVELIKLYGSMELAPLVGLAERIVDVVDTGNTLRANGLTPLVNIADISARLIVNRASWKLKHAPARALVARFSEALEAAEANEAIRAGAPG